tara:strand:+ start:3953 stop:4819 length:867 start_codon:yes stop_codon:yes gene_type:complete
MNNFKKKVYLCSFASHDLDLSVKRFVTQAKNMKFYENIKVFRPSDFSDKLKERINELFKIGGKNRYYGFDSWRPEIINKYLKDLPDGSIIHYSDIGNHLNQNGIKRLIEYVAMTEKYNMTVFEYGNPAPQFQNYNYKFQKYMEYQYTKSDVLKFFDLTVESEIFNSPQIWGGTFFLKKSNFSSMFLKQWALANENTKLLDDTPSIYKNHKEFSGMRGCQSIFSIISKLNNVNRLSATECEWAENDAKRIWSHLNNYPIHAKRDKRFNIFKRFLNRQKRTINRYLHKLK